MAAATVLAAVCAAGSIQRAAADLEAVVARRREGVAALMQVRRTLDDMRRGGVDSEATAPSLADESMASLFPGQRVDVSATCDGWRLALVPPGSPERR